MDIIPTYNLQEDLAAVHREIAGLSSQAIANQQTNRLAVLTAAISKIKQDHIQRIPINTQSDFNFPTKVAVDAALNPTQWRRLYVESLTNIRSPILQRPVVNDEQVYDWRVAVVPLMQLIALRVQVIAAMEPQFRHTETFREELMKMREGLVENYKRMTSEPHVVNDLFTSEQRGGVACGYPILIPNFTFRAGHAITIIVACADIYTGSERRIRIDCDFSEVSGTRIRGFRCRDFQNHAIGEVVDDGYIARLVDGYRRSILNEMPLFAMRAMIDDLYLLANHISDLTVQDNRIRVSGRLEYCLDIQTPNFPDTPQKGENLGFVRLIACNNISEFPLLWHYDRPTSTIRNPAFPLEGGGCLAVESASLRTGVLIGIQKCTDAARSNPQQQWTYDVASKVLQNGMGTVLEIPGGVIRGAVLLWTGDRNNGIAQQFESRR